jgi:hypothetical protein
MAPNSFEKNTTQYKPEEERKNFFFAQNARANIKAKFNNPIKKFIWALEEKCPLHNLDIGAFYKN